jgi:hypothetical protein
MFSHVVDQALMKDTLKPGRSNDCWYTSSRIDPLRSYEWLVVRAPQSVTLSQWHTSSHRYWYADALIRASGLQLCSQTCPILRSLQWNSRLLVSRSIRQRMEVAVLAKIFGLSHCHLSTRCCGAWMHSLSLGGKHLFSQAPRCIVLVLVRNTDATAWSSSPVHVVGTWCTTCE